MVGDSPLGQEPVSGHPALTDAATGLPNRLHFEVVYRHLFLAGDRGVALTLMLVSIGDGASDVESVQELARAIQRSTRGSDLVAYLGANRFGIVLLGTHLPGGRIAANRIEGTLQASTSERVSIGLAAFVPEMVEPGQLVGAAEGALTAAEQSGGGVEMA